MTTKRETKILKTNSMAMPDYSGTNDDYREAESLSPKKLELDSDSIRPAKTRQQLYSELKEDEEVLDQDVYQFAPFFQRGLALILDTIFLFILYKTVVLVTPYEFKLVHYLMDKYSLNFILGDAILLRLLLVSTAIFVAFVGVIVPMAFFNNSFGKKMLNLKVRGEDKYTLSISQAINREFIAKPISILCIAGFIFPFCNKQKKSLHDKITNTFVIRD